MKTTVGILIRALDLGGAEKQSLLQAKLMDESFDVYYFVQKQHPRYQHHVDFIQNEKINFIQLKGSFISRAIQLKRHMKRKNIKIIFSFLTLDNALASFVSLFQNAVYIGGIRNCHLPKSKFVFSKILYKYFLHFVIFNNYSGREHFIKNGFSNQKSVVIHNCINNCKEPIYRIDKGTINILSVGRFTEQKDYLTALKVFKKIKDKDSIKSKISYTLIGDGELKNQIENWISELQLNDVEIVISPGNIDEYYLNSDIYLMTSKFEGMPNTIMEAMNYSLPVVSTNVGDIAYLVKEGINGYLTDMYDIQSLSKHMITLIENSEKRISFGVEGSRIIQENFSESIFKKNYIEFTKKMLMEYKN